MAREKSVEISVKTIFSGKQDGQQAFIDLILLKHRADSERFIIDDAQPDKYNQGKVFSDVRVG